MQKKLINQNKKYLKNDEFSKQSPIYPNESKL